MSKYRITLDGKTYEMEIERIDNEGIISKPVPISPSLEAVKQAVPQIQTVKASIQSSTSSVGDNTVKSPMPGTILRINVSAGDHMKKGQSILVLEAMKMENDIVAPKDGTITALYVNQGDTVQGGAALFEIGE